MTTQASVNTPKRSAPSPWIKGGIAHNAASRGIPCPIKLRRLLRAIADLCLGSAATDGTDMMLLTVFKPDVVVECASIHSPAEPAQGRVQPRGGDSKRRSRSRSSFPHTD